MSVGYKPRSIQPVQWLGHVGYLLVTSEYDDWLFAQSQQGLLVFADSAGAISCAQPYLDYWRLHQTAEEIEEGDSPDDFTQADLLNLDNWQEAYRPAKLTPELAQERLIFWGLSKMLVSTLYKTGQLDRYTLSRPPVMHHTELYAALLGAVYPNYLGSDAPRWQGHMEKLWEQVRCNAVQVWKLGLSRSEKPPFGVYLKDFRVQEW